MLVKQRAAGNQRINLPPTLADQAPFDLAAFILADIAQNRLADAGGFFVEEGKKRFADKFSGRVSHHFGQARVNIDCFPLRVDDPDPLLNQLD